MGMNSPKQRGARRVGISSDLERQHIVARPVVRMRHAYYVVGATTLQIIPGIWCISASRWVIAGAAIVAIQKHGGFLYFVLYTPHTKKDRMVTKGKEPVCHRTWLSQSE